MHRAGQRVQLSPTEFKLLRYLMLNANRVLSKAQILDHVWNYDFRGDDNIVESLHLLPAPQGRQRPAAADPHPARRRVRAAQAGGVSAVRPGRSGQLRSVPLRVKLVAAVLALVAARAGRHQRRAAPFFLRRYLVEQVDAELRPTSDRASADVAADAGRRQVAPARATTSSCAGRRPAGVQVAGVRQDRGVARDDLPAAARRSGRASSEHVGEPVHRPVAGRHDALADAGHRSCPTAGCSCVGQQPHRRRPRGQAAGLDRRAGRRRGADRAGLGRRGDRPDQPQARWCEIERTAGGHRRRRPDPAGARPGAGRRGAARPSWAGCPGR